MSPQVEGLALQLGGVETGGTTVRCAWGPSPEQFDAVAEFPTGPPQATVERIADFFSSAPPVAFVGIGAFGPLELRAGRRPAGTVLKSPKAGWSGFQFQRRLDTALGIRTAMDTDVNAAALAEATLGSGDGARTVAYLTVGTGIGLGVSVGGEPAHGLRHPEAGHLRIPRVDGDTFAGVCPLHGDCWEGLASGPALAARWDVDPQSLPIAHPAWLLEAQYLAAGIAAITLVLSPDRVIVGGGVGRRDGLLALVTRELAPTLATAIDVTPAEVAAFLRAPELGGYSGLHGAMLLAERQRLRTTGLHE